MLAFVCKHANSLVNKKKPKSVEFLQRDLLKEMNATFGCPVHRVILQEDCLSIRCIENCPYTVEYKLTNRGL